MTDFTFKAGACVPIQRVNGRFIGRVRNAARRTFIEEHGEPTCPTYEVELAGGETETHQHNETTVIEERWQDDEELQATWSTYRSLSLALRTRLHEQTTRAYVWRGVDAEPPADWIEEQAYWGTLPEDPYDLKFEWIFDISSGWDELLELTLAIQRLPDPIEEAAREAAESFRVAMAEPARADGSGDSGATEEGN